VLTVVFFHCGLKSRTQLRALGGLTGGETEVISVSKRRLAFMILIY
jgi:hypothetical protein